MNRAMFSGVAGLKTHQTKMDVIGNNIANVNTYGYKSQRAVFSDIYYQTLTAASAGTANRGGTNPSTVGYGSSLAVVQSIMNQSSMQNTGRGLDVAITGEGFLQVMDASGNIFYTKAGILDYDSNGYLVDMNGNFVLGSTNTDGTPDSQKIKLDNVGSVDAKQPSIEQTINGVKYTITASNANKNGNVNLAIGASETLPAGQKAVATISTNGAITVQLNAFEKFGSMSELNTVINNAIREANGGKEHPAGTFTIAADTNVFGKDAVKGGWQGNAMAEDAKLAGTALPGLKIEKVDFGTWPTNNVNFTTTYNNDGTYTIKTDPIGGTVYTANFQGNISQDGLVTLTPEAGSGSNTGSITLKVTSKEHLGTELAKFQGTTPTPSLSGIGTYTGPKYFLGGASIESMSTTFNAQGPMVFGCTTDGVNGWIKTVTATIEGKEYTGTINTDGGTIVLKTADDADGSINGTITMKIPNKETILKNLSLAANATDSAIQTALNNATGSGYQTYSAIKSKEAESAFLTGAEIAGDNFGVNNGTVTAKDYSNIFDGSMSIVKVSTDFSASGDVDTLRAYYRDDGAKPPYWEIVMKFKDGSEYKGEVEQDTASASILLQSENGKGYIQVGNPKYDTLMEYYKDSQGGDPTDGSYSDGIKNNEVITATPSTPSKDLGLGSKGFTLTGGTEGGAITLDELSNISIGADGTVTVSHAEKGVVVAGKISLANFANPSGLKPEGTNYFSSSANSGDPRLCDPGSDGSGALKSSSLEMSNVDLSGEFADMITTQRGFQANSRIITVSDTMLEELINLKR